MLSQHVFIIMYTSSTEIAKIKQNMEIGIHTFASANFKDENGKLIPTNQALNELLDRIEYLVNINY